MSPFQSQVVQNLMKIKGSHKFRGSVDYDHESSCRFVTWSELWDGGSDGAQLHRSSVKFCGQNFGTIFPQQSKKTQKQGNTFNSSPQREPALPGLYSGSRSGFSLAAFPDPQNLWTVCLGACDWVRGGGALQKAIEIGQELIRERRGHVGGEGPLRLVWDQGIDNEVIIFWNVWKDVVELRDWVKGRGNRGQRGRGGKAERKHEDWLMEVNLRGGHGWKNIIPPTCTFPQVAGSKNKSGTTNEPYFKYHFSVWNDNTSVWVKVW